MSPVSLIMELSARITEKIFSDNFSHLEQGKHVLREEDDVVYVKAIVK